nr:MAG TPA: hypothetical protein [Caudoviricetes sp.]
MAYEILNNAYLCRTVRSTKLYARPNDIKPSNVIIPEDITLTTNEECHINNIRFFKISDIIKGEDNHYIGMWISSQEIEFSKILQEEEAPKETRPDDSEDVNEQLVTNVPEVTFYEKSTSGTGLPMELPVGSVLTVDQKVNVTINGFTQTRYHIIDCEDPDGMPLFLVNDMWVRYGSEVHILDDSDIIDIPNRPILRSANRDRNNARGKNNKNNKEPKNERERQRQARLAAQKRAKENMAKNEQAAMEANFTSAAVLSAVAAAVRQTQNRNNNATTPPAVYQNQTIFNDVDVDYGDVNRAIAGYQQGYFATGQSIMGTPIGRMLFVHGMPFQFTHYADRRPGSTKQYGNANEYYDLTRKGTSIKSGSTKAAGADFYGRSYEQEIACNIPIMSVVPGEPQYMSLLTGSFVFPSYKKAKKSTGRDFAKFFNNLSDSELRSAIATVDAGVSNKDLYQYYTMTVNTDEYFAYVNTLCKMSAILMGLSDFEYLGTKCTLVDWGNYNSTQSGGQDYNMLEEVIGVDGGVSFAYDPGSSVTDSIGNTLGDSAFTGLIKGISQKAREAGFLFGRWGDDAVDYLSAVDGTDYDSAVNDITGSALGRIFSGQGIIGRASTWIKNSGKGMNIRFPQIWQDSSSNKDYSIEMHFIAPYATNFCKWRYVLVPFFHCFALAAPRIRSTLTMYSTPFLIRAYSKGYFNVEMGMITNLSWRRFGDGGDMVSDDGIPTQIDVTMDFQDMYQSIGMSKIDGAWDILNLSGKGIGKEAGLFFNNTGLMDMLGTMSGVNMNRMNIGERIALYWNAVFSIGVAGLPGNFKRNITDRIRNTYEKWITRGV